MNQELSGGHADRRRGLALCAAAVAVGIVARLSLVAWSEPWSPHHPDEHILPLEALALWEGITPREIGWPASTTRLALSATQAIEWASDRGRAAWAARHEPARAVETLTTWIGDRYADPMPLYRTGRTLSLITGVLQVGATAWALTRWFEPSTAAVGTLVVALSPIATAYSQYVLADVTGLLFVTIAVGFAATPHPASILIMAALVGLAVSSKFHFGIWLLTPIACAWLAHDQDTDRRWRLVMLAVAVATLVVVALVPWFWANPLLALKEFAGTVLVKTGWSVRPARLAANAQILGGGLGVAALLAAVGAVAVRGERARALVPIVLPLIAACLALLPAATVFDRYALVAVPGLAMLAGVGWNALHESGRRRTAGIVLGVLAAGSLWTLVESQRMVGEVDVDVLTRHWILDHVPRGVRIAVHHENNAFLPRSAAQLQACIAEIDAPSAYRDKWLVEGITAPPAGAQPMRNVALTDEIFHQYWCRRELDVQRDPGYSIVSYHAEPRFGAVLESDAIESFRTGRDIGVLVTNRYVDAGEKPAVEFLTRRGRRIIYVHPSVLAEVDAQASVPVVQQTSAR